MKLSEESNERPVCDLSNYIIKLVKRKRNKTITQEDIDSIIDFCVIQMNREDEIINGRN